MREESGGGSANVAAGGLPVYAVIAGAVILIFFGIIAWQMMFYFSGLPQTGVWDRALVVFNSLQALAFAAGGALLGTTVQQARVNDAVARAKQVEGDADKARAARQILVSNVSASEAAPAGGQVAALRRLFEIS